MKFLTQMVVFFTLILMHTEAIASSELINIEDIDDTQPTVLQSHGVSIENTDDFIPLDKMDEEDLTFSNDLGSEECKALSLCDTPEKVSFVIASLATSTLLGALSGAFILPHDPIKGAVMGGALGLGGGALVCTYILCLDKMNPC